LRWQLFVSIGRQHPRGGGWWLLGRVTAAGAKGCTSLGSCFRRRSKMEKAQRGLDWWRILVWLLIGNSDVGSLSLACVCATRDIGRGSQYINASSFREQSRCKNMPGMDVSIVWPSPGFREGLQSTQRCWRAFGYRWVHLSGASRCRHAMPSSNEPCLFHDLVHVAV